MGGGVARGLGVAAAGLCAFLSLYSTQALLPTLAEEFSATAPQTAWTISITLIAVALVAPLAGSVSDSLGRKRVIVTAGLLSILPALLAATSHSLAALVFWRFVQGIPLPFIFAVTVAYIAEECQGAEGIRVTAQYALGGIVGGFGGRLIAGFAAAHGGWRAAFLALAALIAASVAVTALALPTERRFTAVRSWRATAEGFAAQFTNIRVMATCAVGFAVLFSNVAAFTYVNFLLAAPPFLLGPAQLGLLFAVYLSGMVSTTVAARAAIRFGRRRTQVVGGCLAMAGVAMTLVPTLPAIIAGLAVMVMGVFVEQSMSIGYAAAAATRSRSTAVGLYVTSYYIGGAMGGVVPAGVWHLAGWPGCVALVVAVQATATALSWLTWRDPP